MKTAVIVGTRPEIIKMAPIIRELEKRGEDYFILHSGQHYSYNMDKVFFEQLELGQPRYNLETGSASHGAQTGKILSGIEEVFIKERPDVALVQGDTNTVLAGALAAVKLHIKVGHVEAGLRSYDRNMPEEINRILADHCSDYLFAPTQNSKDNLLKEGIEKNKVYVTGNTIVDALFQSLSLSASNTILEQLELKPSNYILATIHRQENVDDKNKLSSIIEALNELPAILNIPVIFPVHPRTKAKITQSNMATNNIRLIEPLDYFSFLHLENNAALVLTDSGGIQEECCILKVPCVTLRNNTERPETIEVGANILAGTEKHSVIKNAGFMIKTPKKWINPFGNGRAAKTIVAMIQ